MSDLTKDALDTAITAHFADIWEDASIVTGYVIQISGVTNADINNGSQHSYYRATQNGQPAHVTLGLLDYAHTSFKQDMNSANDEDDDQ